MKTKYFLLVLLSLLIGNTACDDELSWSSQDLVVPETATHYFELFRGEILLSKSPMACISYMADEYKDEYNPYGYGGDNRGRQASYFTWQEKPELAMDGNYVDDECWGTYYRIVLVCNTTLQNLADGKIEGTDAELGLLEAEARFFRAQAYFQLVNLYAPPYENADQAVSAPGVPLNLCGESENNKYGRSSLAEVYELITADIDSSIKLFQLHGQARPATIYRPGYAAANHLASRIYLYMKNYERSMECIHQAIQSSSLQLYDLNGLSFGRGNDPSFLTKGNTEILFTYGGQTFFSYLEADYEFSISDELMTLFNKPGELRKKAFVHNYYPDPIKYREHNSTIFGQNFRLAELMLNRAECQIAMGNWESAVEDVNHIRARRFEEGTEYRVSAANAEEALEIVKNERFIELSFEELRWFDLRRWGMKRMVHVFHTSPDVTEEFVLEEGSPSYTLPIPRKEVELNEEIEILPRQKQHPLSLGSK